MLKDTIISAFNYDGTLLKWLKKVEEALQGDTLTNIEVVTNSDYSMQLKLTFGDNTFIMSPVFTNKGRGIVSITKTATSGLVDTYTVTYTDNTTSTFTVTNAEGFNANNLYGTLTAGTGIELTNNGQSVTVTAKRLLNEIVDSQGHQRFIEGDIENYSIPEGVNISYHKWSLSGTHLMLVVAGTVDANKSLNQGSVIFRAAMPTWIHSKIYPVFGVTRIEIKNVTMRTDSWGTIEASFVLSIESNTRLRISNVGSITTNTSSVGFRVEFDLIIDTD